MGMNSSSIEKKISGHLKKIKSLAIHTSATLDADAAHQLRIEYKRLRAFIRLLMYNKLLPHNNKALKKIRPLYKVTGAIRELQLQQEFIAAAMQKPLKKQVTYLHVLQQQIIAGQKELHQLAVKKIVRSAKAKLVHHLHQQLGSNKCNKYFKSLITAAENIIASDNFSDSNIHSIRKILKDLCHNLYTCQQYGILKKQTKNKARHSTLRITVKRNGHFSRQLYCHWIAATIFAYITRYCTATISAT